MTSPRILILRAPGANCDLETEHAFRVAGGTPQRIHVRRLQEQPELLKQFQILCIPGGFSYGDDIAAGRILAAQIQTHFRDWLQEFKDQGKLVLGICNGFQVLIKSGILLDDVPHQGQTVPPATLTWNESGKFEDRWVQLRVAPSPCVFFRGIESMYLPVAHAEGKFIARSPELLDRLEEAGQLPLRYAPLTAEDGSAGVDTAGNGPLPFPDNPNGSQRNVAGVCDSTGRVCGLMPHPERHLEPTHHPRWTRRREQPAAGDGLQVFRNAVAFFA